MLAKVGCYDHRVISKTPITLNNQDIRHKVGMIDFYSMTVRTFKCDFEDICENFGHVACYQGTIPEFPHGFTLDDHYYFQTGTPIPICGNTYKMISKSRFADYFNVTGDFSTHFGPFDCSAVSVKEGLNSNESEACC